MSSQQDQEGAIRRNDLSDASTGELVARLAGEGKELVKKEIDLAKSELRTEWKAEFKMASGLAAAALAAFVVLELLLAALVLGLGEAMPLWAAALVVAGGFLALGLAAALVGWRYRVRHPLEKTRKTIKEDAQWAQRLT
jgi:hypothetical protein